MFTSLVMVLEFVVCNHIWIKLNTLKLQPDQTICFTLTSPSGVAKIRIHVQLARPQVKQINIYL